MPLTLLVLKVTGSSDWSFSPDPHIWHISI